MQYTKHSFHPRNITGKHKPGIEKYINAKKFNLKEYMNKRISLIVMMIFCLCLCAGCFGYRGVVKSNWGITLPAGGKEVYEKDSGASFHGDSIRYHALLYDDPEKPAEYLDWKIISGEEKASEELLEKISVPEDGRPDYVNSVIYTDEQGDGSRLFIFYNGSGGEVWILEEFI